MISIPEYNTLFVGLSKVGSTSIRNAFGALGICNYQRQHKPETYDSEEHLRQLNVEEYKLGVFRHTHYHIPDFVSYKHLQHLNAQEYKQILGEEDFENRFKFAIVKNPWAILVSQYLSHVRKTPELRVGKGAQNPKMFHRWVAGEYAFRPFDKDYFDNLLCPRHDNTRSKLYIGYEGNQVDGARCLHHRSTYNSQLSWLTDKDGKLAVDFIGRFENLNEDFRTILNKINDIHPLPKETGGNWDLPWINSRSVGHDYKWYYNDETIEIVREHYREDIEAFGYEY